MDTYQNLIENIDQKSLTLATRDDSYESKIILAIKRIWFEKLVAFPEINGNIDENEVTDYEKSLLLEAEMSLALIRKDNIMDYRSSAEEALMLNPNGAISRMVLSRIAFAEGSIKKGINYLTEIKELYPGARWIYLEAARILAYIKSSKITANLIWNIPQIGLRILYLVSLKFTIPYYWLIIILYGLWLYFSTFYAPFFMLFGFTSLVFFYITLKREKTLIPLYKTFLAWLALVTLLVEGILK